MHNSHHGAPKTVLSVLGWAGSVAILLAYGLVSFEVLAPEALLYIGLNLFGSAAMLPELIVRRTYGPVFLNAVWFVIGTANVVRVFF